MKPTIHEDTLESIEFAIRHMEDTEWVERHEYHGNFYEMTCSECGVAYRENDREPHYPPREERKHHDSCGLNNSLTSLRAFVMVERKLHDDEKKP